MRKPFSPALFVLVAVILILTAALAGYAVLTRAAPAPVPTVTSPPFPAPDAVLGETAVRTADGVATWLPERGEWVFCPAGWTDLQCGA